MININLALMYNDMARKQLHLRADLLQQLRAFFAARDVLEVTTPVLSPYTVTDPHLQSLQVVDHGFLQTSPEYAMKGLLAAGSGDIFQLCQCFRAEEQGRLHRCEFTLLEWYRLAFDHHQLMDEIDALLQQILQRPAAQRLSYQQVFQQYLSIDPLLASVSELQLHCQQQGIDLTCEIDDPDSLLQLLFSHCIEPKLKGIYFVYDFPASQAALAKISSHDARVAERFEVYVDGIELANGFHELTDKDEQVQRFKQDNLKRQQLGLPTYAIDSDFIAALEQGLPNCAGVALGVDRLLMLQLGKDSIQTR